MALYAIGDLHLSLSTNKPMDRFGGNWVDHVRKTETRWRETVGEDDTVILAGDLSWGASLEEAYADFRFVDALPGKKVLLKGNHDYYWTTVTKMTRFFAENDVRTMTFLYNNAFVYGDTAVCGSRGWFLDNETPDKEANEKIYKREIIRLQMSLEDGAKKKCRQIVAVLHYPPLYPGFVCGEILALLRAYGVTDCYYGHLHGKALKSAVTGERDGIRYHCISADYVDFKPVQIA